MKKGGLLLAEAGMGIVAFTQLLIVRDYKDSWGSAFFLIAMSGLIGALAFELIGIIVEDVVQRAYRRSMDRS